MSETNLIQEMSAEIWADEWLKRLSVNPSMATDKGSMLGWFANAIMAGYDTAKLEHKQDLQILELFDDPETCDRMSIISTITNNDDGSFSFVMGNKDKSSCWKHTIKTEEVVLEK